MALREMLQETKRDFQAREIPPVDAELLLAHVLGISRMELHAKEFHLSPEQHDEYLQLCRERSSGIPTQYLIGSAPFRHLNFEVGAGVLIPRPETEMMVDAALTEIQFRTQPVSIVDLGSGSGAIAISLGYEASQRGVAVTVVAVEKEESALVWLRRNIALHQDKFPSEIRVVAADVSDALRDVKSDLVVANPPYIPRGTTLPTIVERNEPASALFGGDGDGLEVPRRFVDAATRILKKDGVLFLEHFENQRVTLEHYLARDYRDISSFQDLNGRDRMIRARRGV